MVTNFFFFVQNFEMISFIFVELSGLIICHMSYSYSAILIQIHDT